MEDDKPYASAGSHEVENAANGAYGVAGAYLFQYVEKRHRAVVESQCERILCDGVDGKRVADETAVYQKPKKVNR